MTSPFPDSAEILDDLGDKVLSAFSRAISRARTDLTTFRRTFPGWMSTMSERGLANLIHERIWAHILELLDDVPEVTLVDEEPYREVWVGTRYQIRFKRHDESSGLVSNYPTQLALSFAQQIPGLEKIHLNVGYLWHAEDREMGEAVLSLPENRGKNVWLEILPPAVEDGGEVVKLPTGPETGPDLPTIGLGDAARAAEGDERTDKS